MAERDDRMAQDARNAQSGRQSGGQSEQDGLDRALQRGNDDLAGDIESNRNLSGSSTYETLSEQGDLDVSSGGESQNGGDGGDRSRNDR